MTACPLSTQLEGVLIISALRGNEWAIFGSERYPVRNSMSFFYNESGELIEQGDLLSVLVVLFVKHALHENNRATFVNGNL